MAVGDQVGFASLEAGGARGRRVAVRRDDRPGEDRAEVSTGQGRRLGQRGFCEGAVHSWLDHVPVGDAERVEVARRAPRSGSGKAFDIPYRPKSGALSLTARQSRQQPRERPG
jgi:hypothetical protein